MLRQTLITLKKGWTNHPGVRQRGAKNLAWRPKMSGPRLRQYFPLYVENPGRRPNVWHEKEFERLGLVQWPKEVGFYNAGDNFEITPEMMHRLFLENKDKTFWGPKHNENTIIHLLPVVEKQREEGIKRVQEVFQSHMKRFGADHMIYNAVMQAYAFAKDIDKCKQLYEEMRSVGLDPNAQTFVNLMLASKLSGEPRDKVEEWFLQAVKEQAMVPVMRLDTEFQMWWDQFERLGSFTSEEGFLANKEEGASPRPTDMWATWGWDRNHERKYGSRQSYIRSEVARRTGSGRGLYGTVYQNVMRRPWSRYKGLFPRDWSGPEAPLTKTIDISKPPMPEFNKTKAGASY